MSHSFISPDLSTAFPHIFLALLALMIMIFGVSRKDEDYETVNNLSIFTLLAVAGVILRFSNNEMEGFGGLFVTDTYAAIMQIMVLLGAAVMVVGPHVPGVPEVAGLTPQLLCLAVGGAVALLGFLIGRDT